MKYFANCKTKEEAKTLFRELAKKYHPDCGGTNEQMIELHKQYDLFDKNEWDYVENPQAFNKRQTHKNFDESSYQWYNDRFNNAFEEAKKEYYGGFSYKPQTNAFEDAQKEIYRLRKELGEAEQKIYEKQDEINRVRTRNISIEAAHKILSIQYNKLNDKYEKLKEKMINFQSLKPKKQRKTKCETVPNAESVIQL